MKRIIITTLCLIIAVQSFSQYQVAKMPQPGYETRISNYIDSIWIIDTHEHLLSESKMTEKNNIDFMHLFHWYIADDLVSSGMSKDTLKSIFNNNVSLDKKWETLKPYWEVSKFTTFGRIPIIVVNELFGINDINSNTIEAISDSLKSNYKPGWYNYVLKDKAKIEFCLNDWVPKNDDTSFCKQVERFDYFLIANSIRTIVTSDNYYGIKINKLDDYCAIIDKAFQRAMSNGMVAVKSGLAYMRTIYFQKTDKIIAEAIFDTILHHNATLSEEHLKPLQNYLMHHIFKLVSKNKYPLQIHTGLLAGTHQVGHGNDITNSKPTLLTHLFREYPTIKFCLFHGSYPYGEELGALAKAYPNVYIDMCWSFAISPSYCKRYLHEWIETVPINKITAFGGDYQHVESIYAHSLIARQIISEVLIEKTNSGYLSENQAKQIAYRLLRQNALEIYNLQ